MKVFLIGHPKSGRSTVAKAIAEHFNARHIDAMSWVKSTFRPQKQEEHTDQYEDEYDRFLSVRRTINPWLIIDHVRQLMKSYEGDKLFIIDGIMSPKDFSELFDCRKDMVIFLNPTGIDDSYVKDHEKIGISVIRDHCFWLSSAHLLAKNRWVEYNFKIPGEESDFVKELGSKNSVFIIRSIAKVIEHILATIHQLTNKDSL